MKVSLLFFFLLGFSAVSGAKNPVYKFDFGNGKCAGGYLKVDASVQWPEKKNGLIYGFISGPELIAENKGKNALTGDFVTSETPFYFTLQVPEGNYRVTVTLGNPMGISNTTVKAESRRLMLYDISTKKGETIKKSFIVNVRSARINETDSIRLKSREFGYLNWDDQLTLEFGGKKPCISAVEIEKADDVITVFLTGNSTVVDQEKEPWASWGQMFPAFFNDKISIANYAESGESLKAFIREKRLDKIAAQIKKGDYLFMEFAHNDQKAGGNHVEPYTSYQEYLMKFVKVAREHGATPVFVTSVNRRRFDEKGKIINTLEEYPDAMRQLAEAENIALIDLNAMSKALYEALGPERSKKAFVHYPANTFPGQKKPLADNTHFSTYGAYELAKSVVEGLKDSRLGLKEYLKEDIPPYDPSIPGKFEGWKWPLSPGFTGLKPDGN